MKKLDAMACAIRHLHCCESMTRGTVGAKREGVAGVCNQAIYLEQRREMMQWYADYLDELKK